MRKQSWTVTFADRQGAIVYTEEIARNLVTGNYDPRRFAPGTVTAVVWRLTEWVGSHDDNTRAYCVLAERSVPLSELGGAE